MDVQFRIAQITDDAAGVLTGAFVFSPPPHLPDVPRVLVERFGGENTKLGPHGWAPLLARARASLDGAAVEPHIPALCEEIGTALEATLAA